MARIEFELTDCFAGFCTRIGVARARHFARGAPANFINA